MPSISIWEFSRKKEEKIRGDKQCRLTNVRKVFHQVSQQISEGSKDLGGGVVKEDSPAKSEKVISGGPVTLLTHRRVFQDSHDKMNGVSRVDGFLKGYPVQQVDVGSRVRHKLGDIKTVDCLAQGSQCVDRKGVVRKGR